MLSEEPRFCSHISMTRESRCRNTANANTVKTVILCIIILMLLSVTHSRNFVWIDSARLWGDALKKSPGKYSAQYNVEVASRQGQCSQEAIDYFQSVLVTVSATAKTYFNLGAAYVSCDEYDKGIDHLQKGLSLNPLDAQAHYILGSAFKRKNMLDEAVEQFSMALNLRPGYAQAHSYIGEVYYWQGATTEALRHLQRAADIKPELPYPHYFLGRIYYEKGFIEKAAIEMETAIRLKPDYHEAEMILSYIRGSKSKSP